MRKYYDSILNQFCDKKTPLYLAPYTDHDDFVYAANGQVFIRVPKMLVQNNYPPYSAFPISRVRKYFSECKKTLQKSPVQLQVHDLQKLLDYSKKTHEKSTGAGLFKLIDCYFPQKGIRLLLKSTEYHHFPFVNMLTDRPAEPNLFTSGIAQIILNPECPEKK
ncbi:MAG TPA: hypothetical protein PLP19_04515 [bacterium]|nr:hypothetical protein [bacterium]HPN42734.1 hypothetical protein [bacterium]